MIFQVAQNEKEVTGLMSWLNLEESKSQPDTNVIRVYHDIIISII